MTQAHITVQRRVLQHKSKCGDCGERRFVCETIYEVIQHTEEGTRRIERLCPFCIDKVVAKHYPYLKKVKMTATGSCVAFSADPDQPGEFVKNVGLKYKSAGRSSTQAQVLDINTSPEELFEW